MTRQLTATGCSVNSLAPLRPQVRTGRPRLRSFVVPGTGGRYAVTKNADQLKLYWTRDPEGLAKWATHPHPWTALYKQLRKHVNPEFAKRLTETYFVAAFGIHSGTRKGTNPTGPG